MVWWRPKRNRTHLRNGFGESGFETTLGVTNRVALLPSKQPVDFGFQRPESDSQHAVVKADGGGAHPDKNLDCRRSTLLARRSRAVAGTAGDAGRELRRRSGTLDRKSTRLNSSHLGISYAVFCL